MGFTKSTDPKDLLTGAILQCIEAATLGMPFEVWKTRMGRHRNENTIQSFRALLRQGPLSFWNGTSAKMIESALKGGILLFSKEAIFKIMRNLDQSPTMSGFAAGAGGGICQTVVMAPMTYLVTARVVGTEKKSIMGIVRKTFATKGIRGFYAGAAAVAGRQASNWAARQGFTEFFRKQFKIYLFNDKEAKLPIKFEIISGMLGGAAATINQPFEVCRIQMQAAGNAGETKRGLFATASYIVKERGPLGLFKGIVPRIGLGMYQTIFMVSFAKIVKNWLDGTDNS